MINFTSILPHLNTRFLYHTMWQIKAEALATDPELQLEFEQKTSQMVKIAKSVVKPKYKYALFQAEAHENTINVAGISITTGYPMEISNNTVAFQIVTLGSDAVTKATQLKDNGEYADYFYWHGFCAALTEALAEAVHSIIRSENAGLCKRLSFGYEALPNILEQREVLRLLGADEIGVTMTESGMLVPEYSTCAIVFGNEE